jgi:hypothetical protein
MGIAQPAAAMQAAKSGASAPTAWHEAIRCLLFCLEIGLARGYEAAAILKNDFDGRLYSMASNHQGLRNICKTGPCLA